MSYKFYYKINNQLNLCEFTAELARICDEWFVEEHQSMVLKNAPKLYKDKAIVGIVATIADYNEGCKSYENRLDHYESEGKECPEYVLENLEDCRHGSHVLTWLLANMLS